MSLHYRLLSCAALLGASLAGLSQLRPPWAADLSLDWWRLPELRAELRRATEKDTVLRQVCEAARAREAAKRQIAQDVLAGRVGLTAAAARFRDIDAAAGAAIGPLRDRVAGATDEERLCREVIRSAVAEAEVVGGAPAGRAAQGWLEAELVALVRRSNGAIALPE